MRPEVIGGCLMALLVTFAATVAADRSPTMAGKAAGLLVEQLRKHPAKPSAKAETIPLYVMDARGGEATRIVAESQPGLNHNGSAAWSNDGRRILFDATPSGLDWRLTRLKAIGLNDAGQLATTDLGQGNCPEVGPDDDRIMFNVNPGAIAGSEMGVWIMEADGSGRMRLGSYGRPRRSPDNSRVLIADFVVPHSLSIIDVRPGQQSGDIRLPGKKFFAPPRWAGEGIMLVTIGEGEEGDAIALVDVNKPEHCEVTKVLWKRGDGPDVIPMSSNYWAPTGRCVFVGKDKANGLAFYGFDVGKPGPPERLERGASDG